MKYNKLMCFKKSLYILCVVLTLFACQQESESADVSTESVENAEPEVVYPEYDMDWNQFQNKSFSQGFKNLKLNYIRNEGIKSEDEVLLPPAGYSDIDSQRFFSLLALDNLIVSISRNREIIVHDLSRETEIASYKITSPEGYTGFITQAGHFDGNFIYVPIVLTKEGQIDPDEERLYCVDSVSGEIVWTTALTAHKGSDILAGTNTLYIGRINGDVAAVSKKDGRVLWEQHFDDSFLRKPFFYKGAVVFTGESGSIYHLNLSDGLLLQQVDTKVNIKIEESVMIDGSPLLTGDLIYILDSTRRLYAFNQLSGESYYSFETNASGNVYLLKYSHDILVQSTHGELILIDGDTGTPRWVHDLNASTPGLQFIAGNTLYICAGNQLTLLHADTGEIVERKTLRAKEIAAMIPGPNGVLMLAGDGSLLQAAGDEENLSNQEADLSLVQKYYTLTEANEYSIGLGRDPVELYFTPDDDSVYSITLNTIDVNFNMFSDDNMMVTTNFNGTENVQVLKVRLTGGKKYRFEIEKLNTSAPDFIFSMRVRKNEV